MWKTRLILNPFPNKPWFSRVQYNSFVHFFWKHVGKGEIAHNEQFLLYPQCFLPIRRELSHFQQIWNCHLHTLWVWKSLKFVVWERVNKRLTSLIYQKPDWNYFVFKLESHIWMHYTHLFGNILQDYIHICSPQIWGKKKTYKWSIYHVINPEMLDGNPHPIQLYFNTLLNKQVELSQVGKTAQKLLSQGWFNLNL